MYTSSLLPPHPPTHRYQINAVPGSKPPPKDKSIKRVTNPAILTSRICVPSYTVWTRPCVCVCSWYNVYVSVFVCVCVCTWEIFVCVRESVCVCLCVCVCVCVCLRYCVYVPPRSGGGLYWDAGGGTQIQDILYTNIYIHTHTHTYTHTHTCTHTHTYTYARTHTHTHIKYLDVEWGPRIQDLLHMIQTHIHTYQIPWREWGYPNPGYTWHHRASRSWQHFEWSQPVHTDKHISMYV